MAVLPILVRAIQSFKNKIKSNFYFLLSSDKYERKNLYFTYNIVALIGVSGG